MSGHGLLEISESRWRLWTIDPEQIQLQLEGFWDPQRPDETLQKIAELQPPEKSRQASLMIGLGADLCLSSSFTTLSPRHARKRTALAFQLEETLPIATEDVAADFAVRGADVLGVAAERQWLERFVAAANERSLTISGISPFPLLAAQGWLESQREKAPPCLLVFEHHDRWECVSQNDNQLVAWSSWPRDESSLRQFLSSQELISGKAPELVQVDLAAHDSKTCPAGIPPIVAYASGAVRKICSEDLAPAIDFRQGMSAEFQSPRQGSGLRAYQWAAIALGIAISLFLWRGSVRSQSLADSAFAAQQNLYREVFPQRKVPIGIASQFSSELRRLRGLRGAASDLPPRVPAVALLQQVVAAVPADLRCRLLEVRCEAGRLIVSGEVRSHSDADRLAAALRKVGLTVSPPATQQLPEAGVEVRLSAELPAGGLTRS